MSEPELFDDPARVVLVIKNGSVVKNSLAAAPRAQREEVLAGTKA